MSYIIKNTSALINTRVTDVGRRRISQGNFNISYFQIGDSEVNYKVIPTNTITNNNILEPSFNAHNNTGIGSNKENVKYPYYVAGLTGNTYGIPYLNSGVDFVYNTATPKGFFSSGASSTYYIQNSSGYTVNSNLYSFMSAMTLTNSITLYSGFCSTTTGTPQVNHFVTFYLDTFNSCSAITNSQILTYKIQSVSQVGNTFNITLDRKLPDFSGLNFGTTEKAKAFIYPSGMTEIYDTVTPQTNWQFDTLNFESPCDVMMRENTLIWNMNIPWTESPAGLFSNNFKDYKTYNSITYNGTKELLGYQESSGQTDTDSTYYMNSFDEKVIVRPEEQKAIAIIHYTNNDIDFVYGEKFATEPTTIDKDGSARKFKLSIPTVMWHKSTTNKIGLDLYIDPPGYPTYFKTNPPNYIKSTKNLDMNDPGIR